MQRLIFPGMLIAMLALAVAWSPATWAQDDAGGDGEAAAAAGGEEATGETAAEGAGEADVPGSGPDDRMSSIWKGLVANWRMGGPTMYGLGFVAIIGLIVIIDRLLLLRRGRIAPHGLADKANQMWQSGQHAELIAMAKKGGSTLGKAIAFIAEHRSNPYDNIVSGAEDIAAREFELHTRRNYWLAALGTIAPLLGLMGTIFGLMGAFATIGMHGSMDDPSVLAGDIGEAMITTATGLIIAVPLLFIYHIFRSRTSSFASLLAEEVSNLMHAWFLQKEAK